MSQSHDMSREEIEALVAAINPYAGGNSKLARSIRARLQPRDSKGRWIRTGVGVSLDFNINGQVFRAIARSVGPSSREGYIQVYVPKGDDNLSQGFYEVESGKGEVVKAVLPGPTTAPSQTSITDSNVIDINSVKRTDAPEGWDYSPTRDGKDRWASQDGQLEIVENAETGKIELFDNGEKISEHSEVAYAFAESDRRDIEQSLTKRSREVVARLRRDAEDARTAKDATPADLEKAKEALDSALFNDPDAEESLELVDSSAPNPDSLGEDVEISEDELEDMRRSPLTSKHLDEDGNFTPERKALHDEIVRRALEGSTPVENPTQWMNGGGPGAGKSSLTEGINRELTGYDENSVLLDPDEVKRELPEVKEALARLEAGENLPEDEEWAGFSHEESSYIAKRIHLAALERHHNVIIDGTGDSGVNSVRKKVELARKNGYQRVEANYLYLEPDEGIQRAKARQERSFRKVPETVIKKTYETISTIFPQLEEEGLFDTLRLFDNNQEQGVTAKLIFEQKDGETQILDEGAYERFRQAKASDGGQPPTPPTPPVAELPEEEGADDFTPKIRADEVEPGMAVVDTDFDVQKVGTFISVDDTAVPPKLFHVTTNRDGVVKSGKLATTSPEGAGFGGVDRNVVSFSGTQEEALQMHADLKDYVRFRQAKTEQEVKDIITDFYAKYDIPAPRRDGLLNQLADGQWENGTNRHNAMTQYFNERESATGIPNPVILDNDSWETVSPDNIALLSIPKDRVASTGAAVSLIPSGTSVDEFRVHGSIPVTEDDVVDIDSLTDPDLDDVTVVPLESLSDAELSAELADIQQRYQKLQFEAGTETVDKEIQRIANRYNNIQRERGRRQNQQEVDKTRARTVESLETVIQSVEAQIGRRIIQGRDTKDLDERYQDLIEKRYALQKGEQIDDGEIGQEADAGTEGTVPRGVAGAPSRSARVERRGDSLRDVSGNVIATRIPEPTRAEELREGGSRVVELFEVDKEKAEFFRESFELAREASTYGSSVTLHDLDYYQQDGVRMFLTQDGLGGVVLNGDEIVTGFMHPEASDRGQGAIVSMVSSMVDQGGRRLDAYDTVLPGFYAEAGFRPVARLRWDDQFAPDDWDKKTYAEWNNGEPDIVFMVFDPERFGSEYDQSEGQYIDSYETGPVAQQRALEGFDEDNWVQIREQRRERARARRIETQKQNEALKQEDGLLVGEVPENENGKPKNQALVLSPLGQVVEVTSPNGRKMRFIKVGRDVWKRSDKPDDHTRYRSHQIRRDKVEYVKTEESDVPSLDLLPRHYNAFRPVPYPIPRTSPDEELKRLRSIYARQAETTDNSISSQRAESTIKLIDRVIARREARNAASQQTTTDRVEASRPRGRRQNAPLIENNDPESGSVEPHTPAQPQPNEDGVTDNPELIANTFSTQVLRWAYGALLAEGRDSVMLTFRTDERDLFSGTRASVPITAIRDALQLQGVDTNTIVAATRNEKERRSQNRDSTPVTAADVDAHLDRQEELRNLYATKNKLETNERLAVLDPANSSRLDDIQTRLEAVNNRIRRLELEGFRITEMPSADSIQGFVWNSATTPDIYRPGLIMDALQTYYPNAELNSDGELIVGVAEHTVILDGVPARFRYEAVITKTDDEQFYTYIRETNLSDENPATRSRSMRYGQMRQSARAVNNEAVEALKKISNTAKRSNIHSWFNDPRRRREGREPRFDIPDEQGMPHHEREGVLTRESILKIQAAVDEDGITEEMIGVLYNYLRDFGNDTGVLQALYSSFGLDAPTLNRFVDEVNQHVHERDGLNSFSFWESNNGTPLVEGDLVTYVGDPRQRGYDRLAGRQAIVKIRSLEHTSNNYTYTDYVQVQLLNADGTVDTTENTVVASSHNFRLDRTLGNTDGSERRGPGAISVPLPVLTTRAGNRYAGRGRLGNVAPFVTEYDRDTLASPTVEIDGVQYRVQASRQSLIGPDLNNINAQPKDLQTGDFIMSYDPEISSRRLVEVVNVETLDNGNIKVTTVEPIDLGSAKVSQTEYQPDEFMLDVYRYDPNFTPDEETLTDAHVGRIREAARNVRLDELSRETMITVNRLLNFDLDSEDLTIVEYRQAMVEMLNNRTDEGLAGPVSVAEARRVLDVAMNRGLPSQTARDNIQAVSNVATQRATEIGVDSGQTTTPTGGVPVASASRPRNTVAGYENGPYGPEDGTLDGMDRDAFEALLRMPDGQAKTRAFNKLVKTVLFAKIYGTQFALEFVPKSNWRNGLTLNRGELGWQANIVDPATGQNVGFVHRTYRFATNPIDPSGDDVIDVHHDYVWFTDNSATGTGFATDFYYVSDNFYESTGVDINTIGTARDGSYTWGLANFTWNSTHNIHSIMGRLYDKADEYDPSDPITATRLRDLAVRLGAPAGTESLTGAARARALIDAQYNLDLRYVKTSPDYPDPIDISSLLDPNDAQKRAEHERAQVLLPESQRTRYKTLGREIMEGTGWSGIRYLNPALDPRPDNRKNKKSTQQISKEESARRKDEAQKAVEVEKLRKEAEELEKAKKEAEERQKSEFSPPQGRTITSLSDVSNAAPGDVLQVTEPGYELIYKKQEDGTWDIIYYGSDSLPTRSEFADDDLDIVDGFSGDLMSARIFSTPEEREYFAQYSAGTLKLDNPTRETVEKALRDGDIVTMEALYRGNLLGNGQGKFGRNNFTLQVNSSRIESRGTDYDVYEVGGDILNENGQRIGPFRREIRMMPDGTLEMYHGILKIEDDRYKRSGFGTDFTRESEALYRQMGVDTIRLQTAWEGSYFWAMQDYEWDLEHAGGSKYDILSGVPAALQNALDRTKLLVPPRPKDVAALEDIIERMAGLDIDDPNFPSPREIAMLKSEDPSENDDGRGGDGAWMQFILENTGWFGKKRFS